ncbi:MAG TPA: efflux RND transporter periplasmic adaptor subunit, partial [Opitutaceae bacterium]|nr:efflux RND transporter periplasmic adaptor subunit [Opitutaceae bacterium]
MLVKHFFVTTALMAAAALCGCSKKDAAPSATKGGPGRDQKQPVEVTQVLKRDLAETLDVVGSVAPNESAVMRTEISGLVRGIFFEEGQTVKKGHTLMKIDDSELRVQLAQAEARFQLTELSLQRAENLRQTQSTTQAEFDRAKSEFASAQADLGVIRLRLEKTEIKAPFDGVVGARSLSTGDYVTTQSAITTLDDLSRLKIEFQVPERYLSKVRPGTQFSVASRSL